MDDDAVMEYFPLPVVVAGTLEIYQELLGLTFTEIDKFSSWHENVRLFRVADAESKVTFFFFFL